MDALKLDPNLLDETAQAITNYCNMQNQVIEDYLSKMSALQGQWTDDQTIGPLLEEIRNLKTSVVELMGQINGYYPGYFRQKAEEIRNRPTF